ncbi:MAG: adenylate/guanylate cyclase domain-containing protein, partial [Rhodospirillales bacterium]|nr:adenylate/guanylate cyclase domain-containing protein [Rhodospirillales bacterium]
LIWSFHLQYEQPATFYLKAPTLLYVFIFIGLRALRFDPKYVVAAGLTAAAGWLFLVWYAVFGERRILDLTTRDYVLYMTSNKVLIGAEIDKILSILLVTAVLAIALIRAQRMLENAVADSTAAQDLSRFVSPEIADRITTAAEAMQPGGGDVNEATVLFSDIEGFSTISEKLSPAELVGLLNDYFAAVSGVIDAHGGVITQFEGDAMLVTFNTARADPDHAANAVRTAQGIQKVIAETRFKEGIQLKTRCGINTGEIVSGAVGTAERLLFTVHGDEVNIAARLEQLNKDYGTYILATEQTMAAAGDGFDFRLMGEVTVRGREQPTCVFSIPTPMDRAAPETARARS